MSKHYCSYKDGMCELDVDDAYQQGKLDVLQELFVLAKENAHEDGIDYSIGLQVLDNLIEQLKGNNK